ncbi:MAG: XRE family transcriptional regulator [Burkholderiales bacterium]
MSHTTMVVEALKRALKARRLTYASVAKALKLSEASVKRMFSHNHFTLQRFEEVCGLAGIGLTDLAREVDSDRNFVSQLTLEQEREIVGNPKLFLVAVCALNHMTLEQIVEFYDLTKTECIRLLLELDRNKFLELLPNNRIRMKVSRTFSWLPNGPILTYFKAAGQAEYFRSRFDGPGEFMAAINAMLSTASSSQIIARLRKLAAEFAELHNDDMTLPIGVRRPATLVLALRPWELDAFNQLRRKRKSKRPQTAG